MKHSEKSGVLLIYTGGTVGCVHKNPQDLSSPLCPLTDISGVLKRLTNYNARTKKIRFENHFVKVNTLSWTPPIDSSNINPHDWRKLAEIIFDNYDKYEGFVILHGTDTLTYTASALSFMLNNLDKPVILTGAQRPIGFTRTDATQNLVTAIIFAAPVSLGMIKIPEVCIFFRDQLFRGNRSIKASATDFSAFESPNYPPLAKAGEHIRIHTKRILPASGQHLNISTHLETNIACLKIFPGMSLELFRNILNTKGLRGVVLETFGAGNAFDEPQFLSAIEETIDKGVVVVNVTQCRTGEVVQGLYAASDNLLARGVIGGADLTPEAALTKMFVVLGKETDPEVASDIMQQNLRGEQTGSRYHLHFSGIDKLEKMQTRAIMPKQAQIRGWEHLHSVGDIKEAFLRIVGLENLGNLETRVCLRLFIDYPKASLKSNFRTHAHCLGTIDTIIPAKSKIDLISLPVTDKILGFIDNRHTNILNIVNASEAAIRIKRFCLVLAD